MRNIVVRALSFPLSMKHFHRKCTNVSTHRITAVKYNINENKHAVSCKTHTRACVRKTTVVRSRYICSSSERISPAVIYSSSVACSLLPQSMLDVNKAHHFIAPFTRVRSDKPARGWSETLESMLAMRLMNEIAVS